MPRRILQGTVVSDAADKTVLVLVQRRVKHPVYKKIITRSKKYMAHDEDNGSKLGDVVRIRECRPLSKRKSWEVIGEAPTTSESTSETTPEKEPETAPETAPEAAT